MRENDIDRFKHVVEETLNYAKFLGASDAELTISKSRGLNVNVRHGETESLEHTTDRGMSVVVYFGQHKGSARTTDLGENSIKQTVASAASIAKYTQEDDCAGIADVKLMPTQPLPDLDLHYPWSINSEQAIEIARNCEQYGLDSQSKITNSEGAGVGKHERLGVYGNTAGFIGDFKGTRQSISCVLIAGKDDKMQRDYSYSVARDAEDLESAEEIGRLAAKKTVAKLGAKPVNTCKSNVLFQADIARSLIGHLTSAINGNSLYRKASFLEGHLGKQVFPDEITLFEDPHLAKALGSANFDSDGVKTRANYIVENGILNTWLLDSYSARKMGLQSTGHASGVHNLSINAPKISFGELLGAVDSGLLVTELMGTSVNIVTGDYSRGAAGFWIEKGEIVHPVQEVTIAGKLQDIFRNIIAVADDVDYRSSIRTGSILIKEMTIAGI